MIVQIFDSYWQMVIEGLLQMQKLVQPQDVQPQLTWHPTVSAAVACGHSLPSINILQRKAWDDKEQIV